MGLGSQLRTFGITQTGTGWGSPGANQRDMVTRQSAPADKPPSWVEPELATLTRDRFSDPAWIFERKLDGERCLGFADSGGVRLMSRSRTEITTTFPEVAQALAAQRGGDLVVDGGCATTRTPPRWSGRCRHEPRPHMTCGGRFRLPEGRKPVVALAPVTGPG